MSRHLASIVIALVLAAPLPADANSPGALRTSTGGTGLSPKGGSGGTGLSSGSQARMSPAKPHATPPAGIRPHTDLAAATKIIGLSSGNLIKHSSLYPKMPVPPGASALSGPVLNKIGATDGGSASFKAVAGIPAELSNGRVYPTNGRGAGGGRPHASLSGTAAHGVGDDATNEAATPLKRSSAGLLAWLHGLLTAAAIGAIGYWMWTSAPKGARLVA